MKTKASSRCLRIRLRERFEELAYQCFYMQDLIEIDRTTFDAFSADFAVRQGYDVSRVPEFLNEIDRANVLKIDECVQFSVESFLDYFVAAKIQHSHMEPTELQIYWCAHILVPCGPT